MPSLDSVSDKPIWGDGKFSAVAKDMTASSVHTATALGNENEDEELSVVKRELTPHDSTTAKTPFRYDPEALASLRPDQVPRFFGALTDPQDLTAQEVNLKDLFAMQNRVDPLKVAAIQQQGANGKLPLVVRHQGRNYIADGHHRLTSDWLSGKNTAQVHYKDLMPVDNALKNYRIAKIDEGLGLVFGWAIICKVNGEDYYDLNVDQAGPREGERVPEHIPEDVMMKAAADFMETARPGNEMHGGPDRGTYAFAFPLTTDIAKAMGITTEKTGLMVAYKPPPDVLAKFKSGEYRGFSIEGKRISYDEHD